MWYCKIVNGAINLFADSDKVSIGEGMIPLPEGLTPENIILDSEGNLVKDPTFDERVLAQAWSDLRAERNRRLAASDWTQLGDAHMSQERKDAWAQYRQELRDLPDTLVTADLVSVTWPSDPTVPVPVQSSGSRLDNLLGQV